MQPFRSQPTEVATKTSARRSVATRQRWRLWMLLFALGLVIVTMRQLNQPSTVQRLGQVFGVPQAAKQQPQQQWELDISDITNTPDADQHPSQAVEPAPQAIEAEEASDAFAQVQDNTYFRPAETGAWFDLLERLQQMDARQLAQVSMGELTYVQLLKQPEVYRGQVVTIRGTLRREEVERPSENLLGITAYHRLIVQPRGGSHWPFVVYCLELPQNFPRGDHLQTSISVTGFFFKNWSYTSPGGIGVAPVVLARSIDWRSPAAPPARRTLSSEGITKTLFLAGGMAALVVYLVVRNTRRPQRFSPAGTSLTFPEATNVEPIEKQLQRLAERESHE